MIDGYQYFLHNHKDTHKRAKHGSGGVGLFIKKLNFFEYIISLCLIILQMAFYC